MPKRTEIIACVFVVVCGWIVVGGAGYHFGISHVHQHTAPEPGVEICELPLPDHVETGLGR